MRIDVRYPSLGNAVSVAVLRSLRDDGPGTTGDLAARLGVTAGQVGWRLTVLRDSGFVATSARLNALAEAGRSALATLEREGGVR